MAFFRELVEPGDFQTCAFYQQDFGTDYLKPTRLLLKNIEVDAEQFKVGEPCF